MTNCSCMCPPMKWQTNMDSHESSTETSFFPLHQRLAFTCVWTTIIHRTGVPVPLHARLPPQEVMKRGCQKRTMARQLPDDLPVKLPWGGKMGSYAAWIMDIYWSIHWRWVKTTGKVIWLQTSRGIHVYKAKGWHLYPLMLADSEPERGMLPLTELGHGRQGQQTVKGSEWNGQAAHDVGVKGHRSNTSMQNAPTYWEVPTPNLEGWLYTLQSSQAEMTDHEVMLYKIKQGGVHKTPKKYPTFDYLHR